MLQVTKLSADTRTFLNGLASGGRSRNLMTSIALGRALANTLSMPSSPVEDLRSFYRTTLQLGVQEKVSDINELIVVDCDAVLDYTYRFYAFRYGAAYPSGKIFCNLQETIVSDFLGAGMVLDQASLDAIKAFPVQLTSVVNGFIQCFQELSQ